MKHVWSPVSWSSKLRSWEHTQGLWRAPRGKCQALCWRKGWVFLFLETTVAAQRFSPSPVARVTCWHATGQDAAEPWQAEVLQSLHTGALCERAPSPGSAASLLHARVPPVVLEAGQASLAEEAGACQDPWDADERPRGVPQSCLSEGTQCHSLDFLFPLGRVRLTRAAPCS